MSNELEKEPQINATVTQDESPDPTADDAAELAGFEAAMRGEELPPSDQDAPAADEKAELTEEKETPPPAKVETPAETPVGVTQDQLNQLFSTAKTVDELQKGLTKLRDDAFGRLGGLERTLKERGDSGIDLDITSDDLKDVDEAVPFLSEPLKKALTGIIKKAKVKVPTPQAVNVDEIRSTLKAEFDHELSARSVDLYKSTQKAILDFQLPTWEADCQKPEFHAWLEQENTTQPGIKKMFIESIQANEIGGVLKKFHTHVEKTKAATLPKPKPKSQPTRADRLAESLLPKGASSHTPPQKGPMSEADAFAAG